MRRSKCSDNVTVTYLQMFVAIHHSTTFPLFGHNAQLFQIQLKSKSVISLLDSN